jgi:alanyl-tRNA synthetase
MTEKLYWRDSHLTAFTARIVDTGEHAGKPYLVLDRTAFYPTGGGQPSDVGRLGRFRVIEAAIEDDGRILHYLDAAPCVHTGDEIEGEIDPKHRREIMQQHTGQHILSQAFFRLYGAETRGFRIADGTAEIDIALDANVSEVPRAIERAEDLANEIVFEDREIRTYELTPDQAAQLPLRKESFITDCVRVVEIHDFDFSPCGGTHAKRTGEVGLVAVRGWERAKQMIRLRFVCGVRALRDYREANGIVDALSRRLTVGRDEIEASIVRLGDENKALLRRVRDLAALAAKAEADDLLATAGETRGRRFVVRIFDDRSLDELKLLAHRLTEQAGVIALLAVRDAASARLVFARSADISADMSGWMREVCTKLDGRGGGKPDFAQGGASRVDLLETELVRLSQSLRDW